MIKLVFKYRYYDFRVYNGNFYIVWFLFLEDYSNGREFRGGDGEVLGMFGYF